MDNQPDINTPESQSPKRRPLLRFTVALLITAIVATGLALVINYVFFESFTVEGYSMQPTINDGERNDGDYDVILLNTVVTPERGDIIVFFCDWFNQFIEPKNLVKRVIGVAGDTVEIRSGDLYVNGQLQQEDYIKEPMYNYSYSAVTVPEGHYYVLGDNRNNSRDSRVIGCVPAEKVIGVGWLIKTTDGKLHRL